MEQEMKHIKETANPSRLLSKAEAMERYADLAAYIELFDEQASVGYQLPVQEEGDLRIKADTQGGRKKAVTIVSICVLLLAFAGVFVALLFLSGLQLKA